MRHKREETARCYATRPVIEQLMGLQKIRSSRALAVKAGVGDDPALRFCRGEMIDTSTDTAQRLAKALGVAVDRLFVPLRLELTIEDLAA